MDSSTVKTKYANINNTLVITTLNKNNISAYPNPVSDFFNIVVAQDSHITIYDLTGKVLEEKNISSGHCRINMQEYLKGVYILSVENEHGKKEFMKFTKK